MAETTSTPQAQPQEKQFLTGNQKKETKTFQNMSVKQKICYLQVKQARGIATNDEIDQLKNLQEEEDGKSVDFSRNPDLKKKRNKEYEEPKDIFKEGDILNYMYNEWLLAGANWLFKKSYKGVAITADFVADHVIYSAARGIAKGFKKEEKHDNTTRFVANNDKSYENYNKNQINTLDGGLARLESKVDRFCNGEGTEEEKKSILYQIVQEMTPEEKKAFSGAMKNMAQNAVNNIKTINYMASTLARTQLMQNAMGQENPGQSDPQKFEEQTRLNALLIAKQIDSADNPAKLMEQMFQDVEKANKIVNKSMQKGKYKGNADKRFGKTPLKNSALTRMNDLLGLDEQGKQTEQTPINVQTQNQTMLESLMQFQDVDKALTATDRELRTEFDANRQKYSDHQARKRRYLERINNNFGNTRIPKNLRDKKKNNSNNNTPIPNGRDGGR